MSFDDPFPPATGIRVGDAERERAADALRRHHAEGRLDAAEFEQRLAACYAARTSADLERLFVDLPRPDRGLAHSAGLGDLDHHLHPLATVLVALAALWLVASLVPWGWGGGFYGAYPHPILLPLLALFVVWRLIVRRRRRATW